MKNIFVGNLDFSVREEAIRSLFEAYGAVERVSIMTDRETGRSRGFAFVEMTNEAEAERARGAQREGCGRALNVNEARPKPMAPPRRGGRGFGGSGSGIERSGATPADMQQRRSLVGKVN